MNLMITIIDRERDESTNQPPPPLLPLDWLLLGAVQRSAVAWL